ncbi:MAG: hypothetical protein NTW38_10930 [Candidatus Aminicenantes bacterium]|nr:hypothetical protein [Candidatus Aminicenantes bacterium]
MAIGKKATDIFQSTAPQKAGIAPKTAPRVKGRPPAAETYEKVTICLFKKHVLFLDRVTLAIREKTGRGIRRAELVRALVDQAADTLDPAKEDFEKTIRKLIPE